VNRVYDERIVVEDIKKRAWDRGGTSSKQSSERSAVIGCSPTGRAHEGDVEPARVPTLFCFACTLVTGRRCLRHPDSSGGESLCFDKPVLRYPPHLPLPSPCRYSTPAVRSCARCSSRTPEALATVN